MKHRRCMYHLYKLNQVVLNWLALVSISEQSWSLVQVKIHWRFYAETLYRTFIWCASMRPPWIKFLFSPRHDVVFEPMWDGSRTPAGVYPYYQPQLVQSHSTHTYSFWLQYQLNQSSTWRLNFKERPFIPKNYCHAPHIPNEENYDRGKKKWAVCCNVWTVPMNCNKLPKLAYLPKAFSSVTHIPHI